ncbi:MAG: hypothetical protein ACK4P1_12730 [Aggregatilineales bacterium]
MADLSYTLVADGSSDHALRHILHWLLREVCPQHAFTSQFAQNLPGGNLATRLSAALERYPCDLLFVHRDAENEPPEQRRQEIAQALHALTDAPPALCVVPVRMTEAWLIFDEAAIRRAAGNPNGRVRLELVSLARIEDMPDPKQHLRKQLTEASERRGRRRREFEQELPHAVQRVAELIEDFSPLRQLSAFQRLERDLRALPLCN